MAKTRFEQTGGAYSMRGDYCLLKGKASLNSVR